MSDEQIKTILLGILSSVDAEDNDVVIDAILELVKLAAARGER